MNRDTVRFLGIVLFAVGMVDVLNIVDYAPNYVSWSLSIIGIGISIAGKFAKKQKPDQ